MENGYFTSVFTRLSQALAGRELSPGFFSGLLFPRSFLNLFFHAFSNQVQYLPQFTGGAPSVTLGPRHE
jgi:hypothetical protein